jgi:hypothetical protein
MGLAMGMHLMTGLWLIAAPFLERPVVSFKPNARVNIQIVNADTEPMIRVETLGIVLKCRRLRVLRDGKKDYDLDATKEGVCLSTELGSYIFKERTEAGSKEK